MAKLGLPLETIATVLGQKAGATGTSDLRSTTSTTRLLSKKRKP